MTRVCSVMLRVCGAWRKRNIEFHEGWHLCLYGSVGGSSGVDGSGGGSGFDGSSKSSGVGESGESVGRIMYIRSGGGGGIV